MSDDHDELHLEMHRAIDQLGKYAIKMQLSFPEMMPKDDLKRLVNEVMKESTEHCIEHGADLVGHVKSFLVCEEGNLMSSIVENGTEAVIKDGLKADSIGSAEFTLHVIVHGIWDDEVRHLTLDTLEHIFKEWQIPYEILDDYYEREKGMDHHN